MKTQTKFKETEIGKIPEDWEVKPIEYFCSKITSGGTPSRNKDDFWVNGTIPWVKTQELLDCNIYFTDEKITSEGLKNSSARLMPINTVSMAMYGATVGKLGIFRIEATTNQACCNMVVDSTKSDFRFLFYALLAYRSKLISLASGAAQQNLNQDIIKNFELPFPYLPEQRAIASILSSLDSKIELNREMNQTLEKMAEALFKHWFVDFEFPNEKGRPYRSSGGRMVESELGKIPEGWKIGSLLEIAELLSGGTPKTTVETYWGGDVYWVSAKDITAVNGSYIVDTERKITETGVENSNAKLLPKNTTVVTARGSVGNFAILSREMTINQTNYGLKAKEYDTEYFVFFTVAHLVNTMKQHAYGTIFDTITTQTFENLKIPLPTTGTMVAFNKNVELMMNKILGNIEQSKNLTIIRDSLLPKLMSGKLRVSVMNGGSK